jgi:outer membrane protein OmpA-like peptidoglycan-associated protein
MKLRSALVAATVLALPIAANAQAVKGLYMGGGVGINILQQQSATGSFTGMTGLNSTSRSTLGPAAVVALGWGFGNGLRAEIEAGYRYNGLNSVTAGGLPTQGGGTQQTFGGMVNVLYDFVGLSSMIQPYVGAGIGYQGVTLTNTYARNAAAAVAVRNGTQGAFAYQAILGAAMPIASVPGLALTAEYRFMGLAGDRSYSATATPAVGAAVSGSVSTSESFNHSVLLGVRYNFGQAPAAPAPVAAPAAAPSRSYLVFFDWDKSTLNDRARAIIKEAADNSRRVQHTRIEVNGYTDTTGSAQYNQGLSVRRAQAVAAELVKNGVPRNVISAQGFGDTKLLVPTGQNVREAQNRRVEIIIR